MSYADPQSWTDVDYAGNPVDWSVHDQHLWYPKIEMLTRAAIERASAQSISLTPYGYAYPVATVYNAPGDLLKLSGLETLIDSELLNAEWVRPDRPAVTPLNYTGYQAADIEVYSYADLLAAAGIVTLVKLAGGDFKTWFAQRYALLRLMGIRKMLWGWRGDSLGGAVTRRIGVGATFADAVASFNAATWQSTGITTVEHLSEGAGPFAVWRSRAACRILRTSAIGIGFTHPPFDLTAWAKVMRGLTYENNDFPGPVNTLVPCYTQAGMAVDNFTVNDIDVVTLTGTDRGWRIVTSAHSVTPYVQTDGAAILDFRSTFNFAAA